MRSAALPKRRLIPALAFLCVCALVGGWLANRQATAWIESPRFQDLLDRETSKGLKLTGSYAQMHRVGFLGMQTDSFTGTNGYRTIVSLDAHDNHRNVQSAGYLFSPLAA